MAKQCVHKSGRKKGKLKKGWKFRNGRCVRAKGATTRRRRRRR